MCKFYLRAEKEKAQYFGELNDLRASVDHLANEKVHPVLQRSDFSCFIYSTVLAAAAIFNNNALPNEAGGQKVFVVFMLCVH